MLCMCDLPRIFQVSIRCSIEFINFEGRVDGESQLQLLSTIKPKELILIRTKEKYKEKLFKDIKSRVQGIRIHMPVVRLFSSIKLEIYPILAPRADRRDERKLHLPVETEGLASEQFELRACWKQRH